MNDDPSGMGVIPPFPGRQVPSPFVPMPSPVPLPITPGNRNNPPMQMFMAPQRFQESPPVPPPPTPPSSTSAGNAGNVYGSADGGTISNGYIVINGVYYPVVSGGTVINSANGGSGNSANITMPGAAPSGPPAGPPSGPPPGAIPDPNGGPPSPDAMQSFMAPQRSMPFPGAPSQKMQWPFPAPPKPRY